MKPTNRNRRKIKYIVKGKPGSFNITYKYGKDQPLQQSDVRSGWKQTFVSDQDDYFYLSAQANAKDARVTVKVYRGSKLLEKTTADGDFVRATVSGLMA